MTIHISHQMQLIKENFLQLKQSVEHWYNLCMWHCVAVGTFIIRSTVTFYDTKAMADQITNVQVR